MGRDLDGLCLLVEPLGRHPHLVGVLHDLGQVLRIDRVHDVEEVLPRWAFAVSEAVRKVFDEVLILLELRPHGFDR